MSPIAILKVYFPPRQRNNVGDVFRCYFLGYGVANTHAHCHGSTEELLYLLFLVLRQVFKNFRRNRKFSGLFDPASLRLRII